MDQVVRAALCASFASFMTAVAFAQAAGPTLEVASVREHVSTGPQEDATRVISGNRVAWVDFTLTNLVSQAYNLKAYQMVSAVPAWMGGGSTLSDIVAKSRSAEHYDVLAKAEGEATLTLDQAALILQTVLADRFHLRVHWEMRNLPVYKLVVGKNGPKLKQSAPAAKDEPNSSFGSSGGRITERKVTLSQVAGMLSMEVDRPVLDRTELKGFYGFTLEWSLDGGQMAAALGITRDDDPSRPSIFTAVQEQLGLKLEPGRAPIDVLVIDHAEKPSQN
jgi:uncharacterized protein (TIGR03435 family)